MNTSDLATPLAITYATIGSISSVFTDGKNLEWLGPLVAVIIFKIYEKVVEYNKEKKKEAHEEQRIANEILLRKEELHQKQEELVEMIKLIKDILHPVDETNESTEPVDKKD